MLSKQTILITIIMMLGVIQSKAQPELDALVNQYIEAIGGKTAWANIKSFKLDMLGKSNSNEIRMEQFMLKPACFKIIFHFDTGGQRVLTYNGENGQILQNGEVTSMPLDIQIEMKEEPDFFDELIFYKEKNYELKKVQDTIIDQIAYIKLALIKSEKDTQYYYINLANYLVEIIEEYSEEKRFEGTLFKTTLTDYQQVDKVLFPRKMKLYGNNQLLVEYEIESVTLNPVLSINDFKLN